jgi:DNA-binding IclR family transcriptional regulator
LHATSSGKVLLAYADDATVTEVLDAGLERFTDYTVTDPGALREELAGVRGRDWASCSQELEVGLNSVAAPVFSGDGEMIAAVSVSGPSYRLTTDDFPSLAERLLAGADEISVRLGFFPHR